MAKPKAGNPTQWRMALSVAHRHPKPSTKSYKVTKSPKMPTNKVRWR